MEAEQDAALQRGLEDFLNLDSRSNAGSSHAHQGHIHAGNDLISGNPAGFEAEDYANFSKWIPSFVKPDKPCEYCLSKGLECYMQFGSITCKACDSLFRPCSFARVTANDSSAPTKTGILDTLHVVEEDVCAEKGAITGTKQLRSKAGGTGQGDDKKPAIRFSKQSVKVLRDWFDAHIDHPYPTETQKVELENATGLKYNQITTWLANTRRRSSQAKTRGKRSISPAAGKRTPAVNVPAPAMAREWQDLNPFERWQHSPPENEPAPINAIADAVKAVDFLRPTSTSTISRHAKDSSSAASRSNKRAPSTTSLETGRESSTSNSRSHSTSSIAWSHGSNPSSLGSYNSFGSGLHGKRDRRRKRKIRANTLQRDPAEEAKRIFQCTFCCDTFKTKYDWTRHEKALHLSLEKWICAPIGPIITDTVSGIKFCVYCRAENPSHDHIRTHSHSECESKGLEARTFYRKDHLRQHLRLMHHCELLPAMESWKASADVINCRCGFCGSRFKSWSERNDHLAAHFRDGANMRDWTKCRGFDPEVAANVTNAMPPYLIGMERDSPNPFSASNNKLWHSQQTHPNANAEDPEGVIGTSCQPASARSNDKATCWEILTIALGRYVKEMSDQGIPVTDDMLQTRSRRVIYDDEDPWNQTPADNPEWLDLFKKAHGIGIIPDQIGGIGAVVPEDVELYIDLGMRIPFSVAQQRLQSPSGGKNWPNSTSASSPMSPGLLSAGTSASASVSQPSTAATSAPPGYTAWWPGKTYTGYSDVPIPASRAAHFTNWTVANPLIPVPADAPAPDNLPLDADLRMPCHSNGGDPAATTSTARLEPGSALWNLAREGVVYGSCVPLHSGAYPFPSTTSPQEAEKQYPPALTSEQGLQWEAALRQDNEAIAAAECAYASLGVDLDRVSARFGNPGMGMDLDGADEVQAMMDAVRSNSGSGVGSTSTSENGWSRTPSTGRPLSTPGEFGGFGAFAGDAAIQGEGLDEFLNMEMVDAGIEQPKEEVAKGVVGGPGVGLGMNQREVIDYSSLLESGSGALGEDFDFDFGDVQF